MELYKILSYALIFYITIQVSHSKLTNIKVFFKEDTTLYQQDEQPQVPYPNKFVHPVSEQEELKRSKRTSTLLQNENPGTLMDPLQIIHLVTKPEYGILFEHQDYLMQGLR